MTVSKLMAFLSTKITPDRFTFVLDSGIQAAGEGMAFDGFLWHTDQNPNTKDVPLTCNYSQHKHTSD